MEVFYIAIVLAKSFIAAGDEEEILLPVKVIAKVKKAFPDNAGFSCRAICRSVGRRKIAVGRAFTISPTCDPCSGQLLCSSVNLSGEIYKQAIKYGKQ